MTTLLTTDTWIAISGICTGALALATFGLAYLTYRLEKAWVAQGRVNMWLGLKRQFDSSEIKKARKKLAQQFTAAEAPKHEAISETLLDFFEDVGCAYRKGFLNRELGDSTFGYYVCRWWEAAKSYVDQERKRHGEDGTLFEDFEHIASRMRLPNEVIDHDEIQLFLENEARLD